MIYQFKQNFTKQSLNAQAIGEELERIRQEQSGRLETERVVEEAKVKKSPLHSAFTWDDTRAAHLFRLEEARHLIRHVVCLSSEADIPQRAFFNVTVVNAETQESERYYQSAAVISQNPQEYDAALKLMLQELSGAQNGLEQLQKLAPRGQRMKVKQAHAFVGQAQKSLQPAI